MRLDTVRHLQLGFGWREDPRSSVFSTELLGEVRARVRVETGAEEVAMIVDLEPMRRDRLTRAETICVRLRLAPPVTCSINGAPAGWSMLADATLPGGFGSVVAPALDALQPAEPCAQEDDAASSQRAALRSTLCHAAEIAGARALSMCDAHARGLALDFPEEARLFVYGALLDDATGRVERMVHVCPVLLTLAADEHRVDILEEICAGAPLECFAQFLGPGAIPFARRAPGPLRAWTFRAALAACGRDVNDVPARGRLTWFSVLADWRVAEGRLGGRSRRLRYGGFVSRHALELAEVATERVTTVDSVLGEILDWIVAGEGLVPGRASSPMRVLERVARWHRALTASVADPHTPFPAGPVAEAEVEGISAWQIGTVGELAAEGSRMTHCVASRTSAILRGLAFVYRANVRGQRVTIEIARRDGYWRLVEAKGAGNSSVTRIDLIHQWVSALATPQPCWRYHQNVRHAPPSSLHLAGTLKRYER